MLTIASLWFSLTVGTPFSQGSGEPCRQKHHRPITVGWTPVVAPHVGEGLLIYQSETMLWEETGPVTDKMDTGRREFGGKTTHHMGVWPGCSE